jgi:hypothetical protein
MWKEAVVLIEVSVSVYLKALMETIKDLKVGHCRYRDLNRYSLEQEIGALSLLHPFDKRQM